MHTFKRHGFFWVMLVLFTSSLTIHWITAWYALEEEQKSHGQILQFNTYLIEVTRQTFENIQSEMLQLMLQIVLIAYLWFAGSPSSSSEEERVEEKIDFLISKIAPDDYEALTSYLDKKYPKK